jgi:hypothetical protein
MKLQTVQKIINISEIANKSQDIITPKIAKICNMLLKKEIAKLRSFQYATSRDIEKLDNLYDLYKKYYTYSIVKNEVDTLDNLEMQYVRSILNKFTNYELWLIYTFYMDTSMTYSLYNVFSTINETKIKSNNKLQLTGLENIDRINVFCRYSLSDKNAQSTSHTADNKIICKNLSIVEIERNMKKIKSITAAFLKNRNLTRVLLSKIITIFKPRNVIKSSAKSMWDHSKIQSIKNKYANILSDNDIKIIYDGMDKQTYDGEIFIDLEKISSYVAKNKINLSGIMLANIKWKCSEDSLPPRNYYEYMFTYDNKHYFNL